MIIIIFVFNNLYSHPIVCLNAYYEMMTGFCTFLKLIELYPINFNNDGFFDALRISNSLIRCCTYSTKSVINP